ncbi:MAG: hypothetical protein AB7D28_01710 [Candidatus Berkiella sp.]
MAKSESLCVPRETFFAQASLKNMLSLGDMAFPKQAMVLVIWVIVAKTPD